MKAVTIDKTNTTMKAKAFVNETGEMAMTNTMTATDVQTEVKATTALCTKALIASLSRICRLKRAGKI